MKKEKIAIGADHAGFELKEKIKSHFSNEIDFLDFGTFNTERVDYPDFAKNVAQAIQKNEVDLGILICGSGIGMSIAANKLSKIRAAVVESKQTAKLSKEHNNANILCLGARILSDDVAFSIIKEWLNSKFEGGRHIERIEKIYALENNTFHSFQNSQNTLPSYSLQENDLEIFQAIELEEKRQISHLEMIASENYVSPSVLEAQGSILTNKYAEGYPKKRYYGGCEYVDIVETLALERLKKLFNAKYANVQPHSGSQANMAVYFSCLKPGDKILGMNLAHGGHLTHGAKVNFSGKIFQTCFYGVNKDTGLIDYDELETIAKKEMPRLIVAGASAYPRIIDFKKIAEIAKKINAKLLVDMAHIAGLVAAGLHPTPVEFADFITSTTHKTLRGPRGGFILTNNEEEIKTINSNIFPGIQGGPLMHVIAAKAVAFKEALRPEFKTYANQVITNSKTLANALMEKGYKLISNGTDNHLILVDLTNKNITGKDAEIALGQAGITVNKNAVPFDTQPPMITSGIRIGTAALTTRGFKENEMRQIAKWIDEAITHYQDESYLQKIYNEVLELTISKPLFSWS